MSCSSEQPIGEQDCCKRLRAARRVPSPPLRTALGSRLTPSAHFVQTAHHDDFWSLHNVKLVLIILKPLVNPRVFHVFFAFQITISQFNFTIRWFLDVSSSVAILDPISTFNIPDVNLKTVLLYFFMFYMHLNIKGESINY